MRIVEFNSINFVADSDEITAEQAQQLDRVVVAMQTFPDLVVHVVGNTDPGEETLSFVISQRRAEAVVAYLVSRGIDPARCRRPSRQGRRAP